MWGSASCTLQKSEKTLVAKVYSSCSVERCAISLTGVLRAGVEHQSVEPVECADSVADDAAAALLVAQIARQQRQAASLAVEQRAERSGIGLFGRQIVDGDVGPFAGESDGDGTADSRVAAVMSALRPSSRPCPR